GVDQINAELGGFENRRFETHVAGLATGQRPTREVLAHIRTALLGGCLAFQKLSNFFERLVTERHSQSPLKRRASTVTGSAVSAAMAGSDSSQSFASVTTPPHSSGFSWETIGSSRSFFGT